PATTTVTLPDSHIASGPHREQVRHTREVRHAVPMRTVLARVVGAKTDHRARRVGAGGEADVARALARLGDHWKVLHAVPVGEQDSDIDHVVIGPVGVLTITTENHPDADVVVRGDTVTVNGSDEPYVRDSRHEAEYASRLLSAAAGIAVQARGVLAFAGAQRGFTVEEQPSDVSVVTLRGLPKYLCDLPTLFDDDTIEHLYAVARHLATWRPDKVARQDFASADHPSIARR
ncbi:nuclease-related domain-containing protein, partial [uncultured Jatrophihabitans sp.]|uniref:nuclease-related domain-containing protein n=1 Tax=uncultured Jatrophihabitans sp. TaxID=1610747 RepID=UPI0035CAD52F